MPEMMENHDQFYLTHLQGVQGNNASYNNLKFIGKGGNGTTFFVSCVSGENMGCQFALKVFHKISDNRRRQRFFEEVNLYKSLPHPSMVNVYDEGVYHVGDRQYPFAIVDYMPQNLKDIVGLGTPQIPRYQTMRYMMNVISGVAFIHRNEPAIVHRDIKPANILINGPIAKIGDLGLAKVLMDDDPGQFPNSDSYAAMPGSYRTPELVAIARGERVTLTTKSDIYQCGLVLYQCLTGWNPQKKADRLTDDIELDVREISGHSGNELYVLIRSMLRTAPECRPTAEVVFQNMSRIHDEVCKADAYATGHLR